MNKYLLLRDNKQSGPYTTDELITRGIKPYDLVWIEGKSAAWRYPSEIEELQLYAPVVEEQPYDRFFARDGHRQPKTDSNNADLASDIPATPQETTMQPQMDAALPKSNPPEIPQQETTIQGQTAGAAPQKEDRQGVLLHETEPFHHELPPINITPVPATARRRNRFARPRLSRAVIVAGFAVLMFISFLVINYRSERHQIDELNVIMQQLETQEEAPLQGYTEPDQAIPPTGTDANASVAHTTTLSDRQQAATGAAGRNTPNSGRPRTSPAGKTTASNNNANSPVRKPDVANSQLSAAQSLPPADPQPESANLYTLVEITANEYKTGILGGISDLRLELNNHSQRELQRVFVELRYLGPEKKVVRTKTVYFENVAPGGRSVLEVPKSNRGVTVDYIVTNIKS